MLFILFWTKNLIHFRVLIVLMVLSAWLGLLLFVNNVLTQVSIGTLCQKHVSIHHGGVDVGFSYINFRPTVSHMAINYWEARSDAHCVKKLIIVRKNLPPLSSLFFYCSVTLPELDSLLPTEACWWKQNGWASHCRDFCLELCQITIWLWHVRKRGDEWGTCKQWGALFLSKLMASVNGLR